MATRVFRVSTRRPPRQGRRVLGVATGPRPPAYDVAVEVADVDASSSPQDDEVEPTLALEPELRKAKRSGTHDLGGLLGAGGTVTRGGHQKFVVADASGREVGTVRVKTLPSRIHVDPATGSRAKLRLRFATKNPLTGLKREFTGERLATWEGDDGLRIHHHDHFGVVEVDTDRWSAGLLLALVAGMVGQEFGHAPTIGD